jgi:hypothetical protein
MNYKTACELLDIAPDEQICPSKLKRQYRCKALLYHPDKNLGREREATEKFQQLKNAYDLWLPQIENLGPIRSLVLSHVVRIYNREFSNPISMTDTVEKVTDLLMEPLQRRLYNFQEYITFLERRMDDATASWIMPDFTRVVKELLYEVYRDIFGQWVYPRIQQLIDVHLCGKITGMLIECPEIFHQLIMNPDHLQHKVCESISILLQNMSKHSFDEDVLRATYERLTPNTPYATKIQRTWRAHREHMLNSSDL